MLYGQFQILYLYQTDILMFLLSSMLDCFRICFLPSHGLLILGTFPLGYVVIGPMYQEKLTFCKYICTSNYMEKHVDYIN